MAKLKLTEVGYVLDYVFCKYFEREKKYVKSCRCLDFPLCSLGEILSGLRCSATEPPLIKLMRERKSQERAEPYPVRYNISSCMVKQPLKT